MNELREAHALFLQSHPWDTYFTITCRQPPKDASNFARREWRIFEKFGASRCYAAIESHPMGHGLHSHGLIRFPDWQGTNLTSLWSYVFKAFGRAEFGGARDTEDVSRYCAKYVTKNGVQGDYFYFGTPESWTLDR